MGEKCLIVTTLALLLLHPSSTIRCFRSNSHSISPQANPTPPSSPHKHEGQKSRKKPRKKLDFPSNANYLSTISPLSLSPTKKMIGAVSKTLFREVLAGEELYHVVEDIFQSGWPCEKRPTTVKILKVNHNEEVNKIEAHGEMQLKSDAQRSSYEAERTVIGYGNELLKFHGTNVTCRLRFNGVLNICSKKGCGVCRMISFRYIAKVKQPVLFYETSWAAHHSQQQKKQLGGESGVNGPRSEVKAMIICSSIVSTRNSSPTSGAEVVSNPMAMLPCFVVIYSCL